MTTLVVSFCAALVAFIIGLWIGTTLASASCEVHISEAFQLGEAKGTVLGFRDGLKAGEQQASLGAGWSGKNASLPAGNPKLADQHDGRAASGRRVPA